MMHADVEKWITMLSQQIQRQAALAKEKAWPCGYAW